MLGSWYSALSNRERALFTIWRSGTARQPPPARPSASRHEQADRGDPGGAGRRDLVEPRSRRCRRSPAPARSTARTIGRRPSMPSSGVAAGFDADGNTRAGDQVVGVRRGDAPRRRRAPIGRSGNPAGASRRAAATGIESPRRCTPSAPQASATSSRSLTTTRVRGAARDGEQLGDQRRQRARPRDRARGPESDRRRRRRRGAPARRGSARRVAVAPAPPGAADR